MSFPRPVVRNKPGRALTGRGNRCTLVTCLRNIVTEMGFSKERTPFFRGQNTPWAFTTKATHTRRSHPRQWKNVWLGLIISSAKPGGILSWAWGQYGMDTDSIDFKRALMRRELIREANVRGMLAKELKDLLDWSESVHDVSMLDHPSFPGGIFNAWKAHRG